MEPIKFIGYGLNDLPHTNLGKSGDSFKRILGLSKGDLMMFNNVGARGKCSSITPLLNAHQAEYLKAFKINQSLNLICSNKNPYQPEEYNRAVSRMFRNPIKENTKMVKTHLTFHYLNGQSYTARNVKTSSINYLVNIDFEDQTLTYSLYDEYSTTLNIKLKDVIAFEVKQNNLHLTVKNPKIKCMSVKNTVSVGKIMKTPRTKVMPVVNKSTPVLIKDKKPRVKKVKE